MTLRTDISFRDLVGFDLRKKGRAVRLVAGVDEAGRGAMAGPVVAAAVICEPNENLSRVRDSKLLSEPVREKLYELIGAASLAWGVGIVGPGEIDRINIFNATLKAMGEALAALDPVPCLALIDGRHVPPVDITAEAVKGGDGKSFCIAAASIIAKVTRDRIMRERAVDFPGYGFDRNKGYGTREHMSAIRRMGRTGFHRMTFRLHT
ncbi:MAG TPA: ribonuclease HII [Patescibacteria group bacterium]|nr:ribonuclease HII [Patescibacteria group bacterium]